MPPKKVAGKANLKEDKQIKEPVKRTTRAAKNKRELSDEEPIDTKKKKVTDKANSKETNKRSKATVEPIEENVEIPSKLTTKRKRTAAVPKETKSAKIKKDVNDNELLNEEDDEELINEDDNGKPTTSVLKSTRARGKKAAAVSQVKKVSKGRKKATDLVNEEDENIDNDNNDQAENNNDNLDKEEEKNVPRKSRNKKQVNNELAEDKPEEDPEPIEEENPKKRGRAKKQIVETVEDEKDEEIVSIEPQQPVRRGRAAKKTIVEETEQQKEDNIVPAKKRGRSKKSSESERNKLEVEPQKKDSKQIEKNEIDSQPVRKGRSRATKVTLSQENEHVEVEKLQSQGIEPSSQLQKKASTKRGQRAAARQESKDEDNVNNDPKPSKKLIKNKEEITEQDHQEKTEKQEDEEEAIKEPEQAVTRKGRGRSKQTTNKELDEELNKEKEVELTTAPKRGRKTKKDHEENNNEIIETQSQPIETELEVAFKKSRRTKKDREEDHNEIVETQSQPIESEPIVALKKGRRSKKEQEEDHNEIVETQSQPIESEPTALTNKRGRRPTKKVIENNELLETRLPAARGRRGKKKGDEIEEEENLEQDELNDDNQELEDDEDDNKSEKALVIDLPDEQPIKPKQSKIKKTKETIKDKDTLPVLSNNKIDHQKEQQSSNELPTKGKSRKQSLEQEKEVLSTKNKRKQDEITISSNENLDQIKLSSEEKDNVIFKNEEIKRPIKRGRHAAITVSEPESPKEQNLSTQEIVDDEQCKESNEKEDLSKSIAEDQLLKENAQDSSSSSQIEYDLGQNDINKVMEEMKSFVEISIAAKDDSSFLNETTTENEFTTSKDSDDPQSLNELTGEIYSAKELEEYSVVNDSKTDFQLSYQSVDLKNNYISTSNTCPFATTDPQSRKRMKISADKLTLPDISETVVAFGEDNTGALGQGKIFGEAGKRKPVKIKLPENEQICYINALSTHSACINTKGQLYTFGNNDECALGRKTNVDEPLSEDESSDEEINELKSAEDRLAAKRVKRQQAKESTPMICDICVDSPLKIYKVTTGDSHTAVLTTNGAVLYWGNFRDKNGKVGLSVDKLTASLEPVSIDEDLDIVDIASGADFILLLDSYGTVYSLGVNDCGQLGRLNPECKLTKSSRELFFAPHSVELSSSTIKIDRIWAGEFDAFVRSTDNRIFAWGLNNYSQLGFNRTGESDEDQIVYKPKEICYFTKLGLKIEKIVSGQHHSLALDDNGRVYAFGRSTYGRLGLGKVDDESKLPTLIEIFKDKKVIDIACGVTSSFAITEDGKIYSWGMASIALGQGDINDDILEPTLVQFKSMNRFKASKVSSGSSYCLLLGKLSPMEETKLNDRAVKNGV